jgi:thiamine pyrophosphate-dependent acetolactate synthase large subunit-like protein
VLPGDVALMKIDADVPEWIAPTAPILRPSEADIGHLADFPNRASRVTLFCGAGCAGVHTEIIEIARELKAPIVHAFRGKEFIEYDNPYDVGMTGLVGFASGDAAMKNCNALLLLGTDFPYRAFYPEQAKIAQVDVRPEALGNRCSLHLGLLAMSRTRSMPCCLRSRRRPIQVISAKRRSITRERAGTSMPWQKVVRTATLFIPNMSPAWSLNEWVKS